LHERDLWSIYGESVSTLVREAIALNISAKKPAKTAAKTPAKKPAKKPAKMQAKP